MKFKFLGTAAAEGVPGPFCACENCRLAREEGGRSIRASPIQCFFSSESQLSRPDSLCSSSSNMDLKAAKVKYAVSLHQLFRAVQFLKSLFYIPDEGNRNVQLMMPRKDALDIQPANPLHGRIELPGIRRRIKGVKTPLINQIAGIERFPARFIKAAMSRRMPRRVHDRQPSSAQIHAITVMQNPRRPCAVYGIFVR